ncbi:hypothetical protein ACHAW5_007160 [Stephanodiscus triporus]|uniref:Uncharacterized protein n=1 Tax=Stephanodiscus triporus TaxID=2934178 RepID=A0ABD3NXW4_9STRA
MKEAFFILAALCLAVEIDRQSRGKRKSHVNFVRDDRRIDPPRSGGVSFVTPDGGGLFAFAGYAEVVASDGGPTSTTTTTTAPERYVVNDLWRFLPHPQRRRRRQHRESSPPDDDGSSSSSSSSWGWTKARQWGDYVPPVRLASALAVLPSSSSSSSSSSSTTGAAAGAGGGEGAVARWDRVATTGDGPSSRGLHCATTMNRSRSMVIFGGAAKDGNMSNEAFVLDAETWTWTRLDCGGGGGGGGGGEEEEEEDGVAVAPVPRAGACLCPLDDDSVLLFGGASPGEGGLVGMNDVWVLTIDAEGGRGEWDCLIPHRDADDDDDDDDDDGGDDDALRPPGRNAATLSAIDGEKLLPDDIVWKSGSSTDDEKECRYFLLNGGWYPFRKTYNDVFLLRISTESDSNSVE